MAKVTTEPGGDGREKRVLVDGKFFGVIQKGPKWTGLAGVKTSSRGPAKFYTSTALLSGYIEMDARALRMIAEQVEEATAERF